MGRKGSSSGRWMQEHRKDPYVERAAREGYRARSVYKLLEIDERDALLSPGLCVVDLGAAPGAWSQYIAKRVGAKGSVTALDILTMDPIADVNVLCGDFRTDETLAALMDAVQSRPVDLVVSDMAPNMAGIRAADQARAMDLAEIALDFAMQVLPPGGSFLVKVFQGEGIEAYRRVIKDAFEKLVTRKPKASRDRSRELYFLASGFRST
jgi:23S rRNA (uridine2552-2'-O)-methyltransferase